MPHHRLSYLVIGEKFGGKDHSMVINADKMGDKAQLVENQEGNMFGVVNFYQRTVRKALPE